jgi:hypothetical protein
LLGDEDSSASNNDSRTTSIEPEAGLFDSAENAVDFTAPSPPSPDGWYDINDFPEPAPYLPLAEQGASTSNSIRPPTPSRPPSEPLYDSISIEWSRSASSEATTSFSSPPPRHSKASPETQLNQEGRLHTGRGMADEYGLVNHTLDMFPINGWAREE